MKTFDERTGFTVSASFASGGVVSKLGVLCFYSRFVFLNLPECKPRKILAASLNDTNRHRK